MIKDYEYQLICNGPKVSKITEKIKGILLAVILKSTVGSYGLSVLFHDTDNVIINERQVRVSHIYLIPKKRIYNISTGNDDQHFVEFFALNDRLYIEFVPLHVELIKRISQSSSLDIIFRCEI